MKEKMIKNLILFAVLSAFLTGCAFSLPFGESTAQAEMGGLGVYYLTQDESQIAFEGNDALNEESGISDYILALQEDPKDVKLKKTMGSEVMLIDYRKEDKSAVLNFDDRYYGLNVSEEVLFRASVAQTILQDKDVNNVIFEVNGEPLRYRNGEEVGVMTASTFIDDAGDEISSYTKKEIRLFFTSADGNGLIPAKRDIIYSSNESLEKVAMEQLIQGPLNNEEGYATVSPDVKINTIAVKNGICYVGVDTALVDKPVDVAEETILYSVVNTLTSLPGVNKVQISINGETDRVLRSSIRLDEAYSYNEEIVMK